MVGCCKLSNLDNHAVAEGLHIHVWELARQKSAKKVKLSLMGVHGLWTFLLKKMKEVVDKGVVVVGPQIKFALKG